MRQNHFLLSTFSATGYLWEELVVVLYFRLKTLWSETLFISFLISFSEA
jgi:hypothetical protein